MLTLVTVWFATVTPVVAITLLLLWAFTMAVPKDTAVSRPELLIVATEVGLVLQVTCDVTSAELLSA